MAALRAGMNELFASLATEVGAVPPTTVATNARCKDLVPGTHDAFTASSKQVFADGALPEVTNQLIAVTVADRIRWAYCIRGHSKLAHRNGATDEQIMEVIRLAAQDVPLGLLHSRTQQARAPECATDEQIMEVIRLAAQDVQFGGKSKWRDPVWFPLNYQALRRCAVCTSAAASGRASVGTDHEIPLDEAADELASRLVGTPFVHRPVRSRAGRPTTSLDDPKPSATGDTAPRRRRSAPFEPDDSQTAFAAVRARAFVSSSASASLKDVVNAQTA